MLVVVPGTVTVIDGETNVPPRAKSVYVTLLADCGKVTEIVFSEAGAAVVPITTESGEYEPALRVGDAINITDELNVVKGRPLSPIAFIVNTAGTPH